MQDLSSTNIKLTWAATTTYDLDKKLKEGWKFEDTLKLSLNLPIIPISPTGGKVSGTGGQVNSRHVPLPSGAQRLRYACAPPWLVCRGYRYACPPPWLVCRGYRYACAPPWLVRRGYRYACPPPLAGVHGLSVCMCPPWLVRMGSRYECPPLAGVHGLLACMSPPGWCAGATGVHVPLP